MTQDPQQAHRNATGVPDANIGWARSLTDKLRVLLHTTPLLELKQSDARRDPELRHYDSLALAVKALDVIIENMGLDTEADRAPADDAGRDRTRGAGPAIGRLNPSPFRRVRHLPPRPDACKPDRPIKPAWTTTVVIGYTFHTKRFAEVVAGRRSRI